MFARTLMALPARLIATCGNVRVLSIILIGYVMTVSVAQSQSAMQFRTASSGNCCEWIAADGPITSNTFDELLSFLEVNEGPSRIVFNSPGGSLSEGIKIGRFLRANNFSASVADTVTDNLTGDDELREGICASACAYAFMGASVRQTVFRNRLGEHGGQIGLHQFFNPSSSIARSSDIQSILGELILYSIEMGIKPEAISIASTVPSEDIFWLTDEQAVAFGFDNVAPAFSKWNVEPYKGGFVLYSESLRDGHDDAEMTLFCREGEGGLRLLITENDSYFAEYLRDKGLNEFAAWGMRFETDHGRSDVPLNLIDGFRTQDDNLYLTIDVDRISVDLAGSDFTFYPGLSRHLSGLFVASGQFPSVEMLNLTKENCF